MNKKETTDSGESAASELLFPSSTRTTKKGFKDLFSFRATKKETTRASNTLFSSSNDSSPQTASAAKKNENTSRTSSSITNAAKPSDAGDQKASRTAGLFANAGSVRATRSSSNLFSGSQEPSTSRGLSANKRKREDEVDSGSKSSSRTANLFEKRAKRPSAVLEDADFDSSDDIDSIPKKTSKVIVVQDTPIYQDSPVDIPSKMSLSQFHGAPAKENVTVVKTVSSHFLLHFRKFSLSSIFAAGICENSFFSILF